MTQHGDGNRVASRALWQSVALLTNQVPANAIAANIDKMQEDKRAGDSFP